MVDEIKTLPDGDLLDGAKAVSAFLKKKGLKKLGERQVYAYQAKLGLMHLHGRLIGSKAKLAKIFNA